MLKYFQHQMEPMEAIAKRMKKRRNQPYPRFPPGFQQLGGMFPHTGNGKDHR
ncbi:hypothetical protein [Chitinophaga agrisoli]|uniref:hypothetical protein n=1 Tax=Chitinophaga agrisoli TaxID=2607653 RepID=UPI001BC9ECA8|nr:hypothetical protein [Chitinophaga agrisoli]